MFFDPAERLFKMFYTAGWRGVLAMATSRDMVHGTRPDLGIAGGNLLLPPGASRDESGRSDGYVAGGPGYTALRDTVGQAALEASERAVEAAAEAKP